MIYTTEEIALRALSLTKEIPTIAHLISISIIWSSWYSISLAFIPSRKLVNAASEWATIRGTGSLRRLTSSGYICAPYFYWKPGCISSDIWPIAWQAEYLIIGLGSLRKPIIICMTDSILSGYSMYYPICDNAITAVYLYLQSGLTNNFCITPESIGMISASPTAYINLSIAAIPNLVVSKSY